ncbi:MAG: hypothetical protein AABZ22_02615, partial [Nitrospirota bacterium]
GRRWKGADPEKKEDRAFDFPMLERIAEADRSRRLVVYCEKNWDHRDDLAVRWGHCAVRTQFDRSD